VNLIDRLTQRVDQLDNKLEAKNKSVEKVAFHHSISQFLHSLRLVIFFDVGRICKDPSQFVRHIRYVRRYLRRFLIPRAIRIATIIFICICGILICVSFMDHGPSLLAANAFLVSGGFVFLLVLHLQLSLSRPYGVRRRDLSQISDLEVEYSGPWNSDRAIG